MTEQMETALLAQARATDGECQLFTAEDTATAPGDGGMGRSGATSR